MTTENSSKSSSDSPANWAAETLRRTITDNPYVPITPTERQALFLTFPAREILYGGAAGGGKSVALLAAALQHVDVPGYSALLLRRTFADLNLPDALIPLSHQWLSGTDAKWDGQQHRWTFPSGATLTFGYLDTEVDKYRYQGAQFQYCVAAGTPVLMANGAYRPIESLAVGDSVWTLDGARPVTRLHPSRKKRSVRITALRRGAEIASQVQSLDHVLLTSAGWACPGRCAESRLCGFSSPTSSGWYDHPYTREIRQTSAGIAQASFELQDAGISEVYDITVAGASHYITRGGFINRNCGFDELSQFTESQFRYLYSRLRRAERVPVPLRMRAASNPGGVGHRWVFDRYVDPKGRRGRLFIPAKLEDNPYLDQAGYDQSLRKLDHITRRQLRHGDWHARPEGNAFKAEWFRYYALDDSAEFYLLGHERRPVRIEDCLRFASADIAGTEAQDNTDPDYTCVQVWDASPRGDMILVYQWTGRFEIPDVEEMLLKIAWDYDVQFCCVEKNGIGLPVVQTARRRGLPVAAVLAKRDKFARSQAAQIRMENGSVFFPKHATFLSELEEQLLTFPTDGLHDDIVDALSIAAQRANKLHTLTDERDEAVEGVALARDEREKAERRTRRKREEFGDPEDLESDIGWTEIDLT